MSGIPNNASVPIKGALVTTKTNEDKVLARGTEKLLSCIPIAAHNTKNGALVTNKINEDQGTAKGATKILLGILINARNEAWKKGNLMSTLGNGRKVPQPMQIDERDVMANLVTGAKSKWGRSLEICWTWRLPKT